MVHGADVVDDLDDVNRELGAGRIELEPQDVVQRALRAFDLGAEDGLLPDVHGDEEIGIGKGRRYAVEPANRLIGLRERRPQSIIEGDRQRRWQWRGDEGVIPCRLPDVLASPAAITVHRYAPALSATTMPGESGTLL